MLKILKDQARDFIDTKRGHLAVAHAENEWTVYEYTMPFFYGNKRLLGCVYRHYHPDKNLKDEEVLLRVLSEAEAKEVFNGPADPFFLHGRTYREDVSGISVSPEDVL